MAPSPSEVPALCRLRASHVLCIMYTCSTRIKLWRYYRAPLKIVEKWVSCLRFFRLNFPIQPVVICIYAPTVNTYQTVYCRNLFCLLDEVCLYEEIKWKSLIITKVIKWTLHNYRCCCVVWIIYLLCWQQNFFSYMKMQYYYSYTCNCVTLNHTLKTLDKLCFVYLFASIILYTWGLYTEK